MDGPGGSEMTYLEKTANTDSDVAANRTACCSGWRVGMLLVMFAAVGYLVVRQTSLFAGFADDKDAKTADSKTKAEDKKKAAKVPQNPFPRRFKAPSLDGGEGWLNVKGEISLKDLKGKIVILDFWTYCCINCMHVLPDLKYLEKKYPKQLVVIGVHSAKFDNEKDTKSIRKAILRYEIEHPVINDAKMTVWRKFNASAWPTLVLIDPEGMYCGYVSGEGNRELLDLVIKKLIAYHKAKKTLDETPFRFDLERHKLKPGPLKFPGKVLADEKGGRLFISDSNHNRIVVTSLAGKLIDIIGSGKLGAKDGSYDKASFDHPQGMTLVKDSLYVADTENHLIRKVDLKKKTVSTIAGTGKQARRRYDNEDLKTAKLREVALNSPWALEHVDGVLYICMAGPHQLWSHKLGTDRIKIFAGTGREDVTNGSHAGSAFAQPSGITSDGKNLYIADSEGSAIRRVEIAKGGKVTTVAGASDLLPGRALFEFGDKDGTGSDARLQHALGVAYHKNRLYVADTYNHKVKQVQLTAKTDGKVTSWLGDGKQGKSLKPLRFSEPSGVAVAKGKLYITDTNNHRICVVDLKTNKVTELAIAGLKPPKSTGSDDVVPVTTVGNAAKIKPQTVQTGSTLTVTIKPKLPKDFKLNPEFPHRVRLKTDAKPGVFAKGTTGGRPKLTKDGMSLTIKLPVGKSAGKATYEVSVTLGYCRGGTTGLCKFKTLRWKLPLQSKAKGKTAITLTGDVEGKK